MCTKENLLEQTQGQKQFCSQGTRYQTEQSEESSPALTYQEEVPGGIKTCVVVSCKIKNSSYILSFNYQKPIS